MPRTSLFIVKMALNFHIWHNNFACYVHAALHLSHRMRNIVVNRIYLFIYIQERAHVWSSRFVFFFFLLEIFIWYVRKDGFFLPHFIGDGNSDLHIDSE